MVWEQELYNQFIYKTQKSFFHTFDTDVSRHGIILTLLLFHLFSHYYFLIVPSDNSYSGSIIIFKSSRLWRVLVCMLIEVLYGFVQSCPAGFNFANDEEAKDLNNAIQEELEDRKQIRS